MIERGLLRVDKRRVPSLFIDTNKGNDPFVHVEPDRNPLSGSIQTVLASKQNVVLKDLHGPKERVVLFFFEFYEFATRFEHE